MTSKLGWSLGAAWAALVIAGMFACSTKAREYGAGGADAGASSSATASGGGGGGTTSTTSSTSGSGGALLAGKCTGVNLPFDVLTPTDLGAAQLSDKLYLIVDPGDKHAMVHVVVHDQKHQELLVRTLVDDTTVIVHNLVRFPPVGTAGQSFRAVAGVAAGGVLTLYGQADTAPSGTPGGVGSLTYKVDPSQGVKNPAQSSTFPQPPECVQGGHFGRLVFAEPRLGVEPRWLGDCVLDGSGQAYLYAGGENTQPILVGTGSSEDVHMNPHLYTIVQGTHLAFFGGDNDGTMYAYGPAETDLANVGPFAFTKDTSVFQGLFGVLYTSLFDGVTLLGGYVDLVKSTGQFYGGVVTPPAFAKLGQVPPGGMQPLGSIDSVAEVGPMFNPQRDPTTKTILAAGASLTEHAVLLTWLKDDLTPLMVEQPIYTPDASDKVGITAAAASPFGQYTKMVVWAQKDASSTYTVKGQMFVCEMTGG